MDVNLEVLGRAIKRTQHSDHRAMDAALRETGISLVQWDALRAIDRTPGASAHALAVASFQSDQAFGTLSARLVAAGLVERRPGVGRRIEHHLTTMGRSALETGHITVQTLLPELFGALTAPEQATLLALLERLAPPVD